MTSDLVALGWPPGDALPDQPGLRAARVVLQGPGRWQVHDGAAVLVAQARSRSLEPTPVTGDWVLIADDGAGGALIDAVLPRRTVLSRAEAGGRSAEQVVAANVDVVGICAPAGTANAHRVERELTAVWGSGATPVVVVTKADLGDLDDVLPALRAVAVGADVVAVSAWSGEGLDAVRALVPPGATVALIGPSGAGKSSLINALLGEERLAIEAVRADGKGRHTTTSRHLVPLPGGGLLLDTPGMREFAPWTDDGLDDAFADVASLAEGCRFSDCSHAHEPGCAVLAAAEADEAVAERVASWRALQRELAWLERRHDARLQAEERKRWIALTKEGRSRIRP